VRVTNSEGPPVVPGRRIDRALVTIWVVVNLVNLLQAAGFVTRVWTWGVQHIVGLVIASLGVPATIALVSLARRGTGWRFTVGPVLFDAFVVMLVVVDYVLALEWRSPARPGVKIPLLSLFFGSIVMMGAPMFRIDRRLWSVTAATSALLLGTMAYAMIEGVG
jgi:hypothetical protein